MNLLKKYLLTNVYRRPEGEGQGADAPLGDDALKAALAFDPTKFFVPPADEASGGDEGEQGSPSPEGAEAKDTASSKAAAPASPSPTPEPAKKEGEPDDLKSLRATVRDFLTKKPEATPEVKPEATPTPTKTEEPAKDEVKYDFNLPVELVEELNHEEPGRRHKALNTLVNGITNTLTRDFGKALSEVVKVATEQAVRAVEGRLQSQTSEMTVRQDFYGSHPDLKELVDNLPQMDGVVWSVAKAIADQSGAKTWNADIRDKTAQFIRLQMKLPTPSAGSTTQPAKRQPAKKTFVAGGGSGGNDTPRGGGAKTPQDHMMEVLGVG